MAGLVTVLESGATLSAAGHFDGPWREFRRVRLDPGSGEAFDATDVEYAVFVMSGSGVFAFAAETRAISAGFAATVGLGSSVTFRAGAEGLEVFVVVLDVDLTKQ